MSIVAKMQAYKDQNGLTYEEFKTKVLEIESLIEDLEKEAAEASQSTPHNGHYLLCQATIEGLKMALETLVNK